MSAAKQSARESKQKHRVDTTGASSILRAEIEEEGRSAVPTYHSETAPQCHQMNV